MDKVPITPKELSWLAPSFLTLVATLSISNSGCGLWSLVSLSQMPQTCVRIFLLVGILGLIWRTYKSRYSKRAKRQILIVSWALVAIQCYWILTTEYELRTNERKIKAELGAALLEIYEGSDVLAGDLISEAAGRTKATRWKDAEAFVAACREEAAFANGTFDPRSHDFQEAKEAARKAVQKSSLLTWLAVLEAEFHSKLGERNTLSLSQEESAQNQLMELTAGKLPNEARCHIYLLLAINSRRLGQLEKAGNYYTNAVASLTTNSSFPLWKFHLIMADDHGISTKHLGIAAVMTPYSELLWETGEKTNAINLLVYSKNLLTNQPEQRFPIAINLGVFQWRRGDYDGAERTFQEAEQILNKIVIGVPEYKAALYANWMGMILEEYQTGFSRKDPDTFPKIREYMSITDTKRIMPGCDRKITFQILTDEAIRKTVYGDAHSALVEFKEIESDYGNFTGCDPYAVARFFEGYGTAAKMGQLAKDERLRLSFAAGYWWYRGGEPERAKKVGLTSFNGPVVK